MCFFILFDAGVIFILPCIDKWERVDMRVKAFNVPPQKVLSHMTIILRSPENIKGLHLIPRQLSCICTSPLEQYLLTQVFQNTNSNRQSTVPEVNSSALLIEILQPSRVLRVHQKIDADNSEFWNPIVLSDRKRRSLIISIWIVDIKQVRKWKFFVDSHKRSSGSLGRSYDTVSH